MLDLGISYFSKTLSCPQRKERYLVMKKLVVVPLLAIMVTLYAAAAPQSFTDVITDTMCGKKHMMPGKSDADCISECIRAGSKYGLLAGDKMYVLSGDTHQFQRSAGTKVIVEGTVNGNTVSVSSIRPAK
jgi:hypothetical protein